MIDILHRYPRGAHRSKIDHVCERPFRTASIGDDGKCYVCICEAWLPFSVGNITDFDTLDEIWSTPVAQELQRDIADKKFTWCAVEHCGILNHDILQPTYRIGVNLDNSCNLACPSCRREMINITEGPVYKRRLEQVNHFMTLLEKFDKDLTVILIGSGDPLASVIMRPIVLNWQPTAKQKVILFTNGLLMKKLLPQSKMFENISEFHISVDAGSKEVYENVRRPGKFEVLTENLEWLSKNKPPQSGVSLTFTISAGNAADVENFVNMAEHYGFQCKIVKLDDWNTFDDFSSQDVIDNTNHSLHSVAIQQLRSVRGKKHVWISPYFDKLL